jgi:hypothetical protein
MDISAHSTHTPYGRDSSDKEQTRNRSNSGALCHGRIGRISLWLCISLAWQVGTAQAGRSRSAAVYGFASVALSNSIILKDVTGNGCCESNSISWNIILLEERDIDFNKTKMGRLGCNVENSIITTRHGRFSYIKAPGILNSDPGKKALRSNGLELRLGTCSKPAKCKFSMKPLLDLHQQQPRPVSENETKDECETKSTERKF